MKEIHRPIVSIVLPTYNREHLIIEAINSVLNQTYSDWELIIIDDGSTDKTQAIVLSYSDLRIRYLYTEHLSSLAGIRNIGLNVAVGEYIAFLDSDDVWLPHKLSSQLQLLNTHTEASFITNNVEFFGERFETSPPNYVNYFAVNLLDIVLDEEQFGYYPSTLLFKKIALEKIGEMDESYEFACENHYYIRLCECFKGIFINERLVKIRKHKQNISSTFPPQVLSDSIRILRAVYHNGSISKVRFLNRLRHYYYKMGLEQLGQKEKQRSQKSFVTYIQLAPWHWKGWIRLIQAVLS